MFYPYLLHNESDAHCKCLNSSHIALAGIEENKFPVKVVAAQKHKLYFALLQIFLFLEIEQVLLWHTDKHLINLQYVTQDICSSIIL